MISTRIYEFFMGEKKNSFSNQIIRNMHHYFPDIQKLNYVKHFTSLPKKKNAYSQYCLFMQLVKKKKKKKVSPFLINHEKLHF